MRVILNGVDLSATWHIRMTKYRATWFYFTENPQGGGFGSNYCGPQYIALARAREHIPAGDAYSLEINGKDRGILIRGREVQS